MKHSEIRMSTCRLYFYSLKSNLDVRKLLELCALRLNMWKYLYPCAYFTIMILQTFVCNNVIEIYLLEELLLVKCVLRIPSSNLEITYCLTNRNLIYGRLMNSFVWYNYNQIMIDRYMICPWATISYLIVFFSAFQEIVLHWTIPLPIPVI